MHRGDVGVAEHVVVIVEDAVGLSGQYFDACPAIVEGDDGNDVVADALVLQLFALFLGALVGNGDMPAKLAIDVVHDLAEERAVCRGVFQLVVADVIVYHLVDDGIFHNVFGQVDTGIDAQAEVVEFSSAKELTAFLIHTLSEEGLGIAQLNRQHGEFTAKHLAVELLKFLLYVGYGSLHGSGFIAGGYFFLAFRMGCCIHSGSISLVTSAMKSGVTR